MVHDMKGSVAARLAATMVRLTRGLGIAAAIVILPSTGYAQQRAGAGAVGAHVGAAMSGYGGLEGNGCAPLFEGFYDRYLSEQASVRLVLGTGRYDAADPQNRRYTRASAELLWHGRGTAWNRFAGIGAGAYVLSAGDDVDRQADVSVRGIKPGLTVFTGAERVISERWALQFEARVQLVPGSPFAAGLIGGIGIKRY